MGAIKRYFKNQFQKSKFKLEHEDASDFHLSCFQSNRSCVPLLLIRALLFFGSVAIVVTSIVLPALEGVGRFWPIYLTHWGLVMMMISTGFGFVVSLRIFIKGSVDTSLGLPWYIKAYWILSNIAFPLALFITLFYWLFLASFADSEEAADLDFELAVDPVLDIFIHAVNSVVMFLLLVTSRQPIYILHFFHVFGFALVYMFFSIIYYAAGGKGQFGLSFIYPVLDWSQPGVAIVTVVLSAALIIIIHFITSLIASARNSLGKCCRNEEQFVLTNNY